MAEPSVALIRAFTGVVEAHIHDLLWTFKPASVARPIINLGHACVCGLVAKTTQAITVALAKDVIAEISLF